MKYNYHTHTFRCHHAKGEDEEFVKRAIESGYDEIGFSDHCAWPYENFVSDMRMTTEEIDGYVKSVRCLQNKYKDEIKIRLGFECEYFEKHIDWLKNVLKKYRFDYIILGHHFTPYEPCGVYNGNINKKEDIENYKNEVLKALNSGIYSYVAHPDIYMRRYGKFDIHCEKAAREIIQKSIETDTPIEYNLLGISHGKNDGFVGYPHPQFWKIAGEMHATAVIGIDAHFPEAYFCDDLRNEAVENLKNWGVKLTDKIKFLNY